MSNIKFFMKIEELKEKHFEEVKNLLVELQEFVIEIDNFKLNIISKDYRKNILNIC